MVTCSTPASSRYGQITSGSWAAAMYVPSDGPGSTRLAAKARAKWPMNMAPPIFLRRHGPAQMETA
jgi:hypothetical protein